MGKLAIGSANFGMNYGFQNIHGKLKTSFVNEILDYAWLKNIDMIDTAMGYGDSELVIGNYLKENTDKQFKVITKLNKLDKPIAYLAQSLHKLHQTKVYGVLIHDFNSFKKKPELLDDMLNFKDQDKCGKVVFSLYYPEDLNYLLDNNIQFDFVVL